MDLFVNWKEYKTANSLSNNSDYRKIFKEEGLEKRHIFKLILPKGLNRLFLEYFDWKYYNRCHFFSPGPSYLSLL